MGKGKRRTEEKPLSPTELARRQWFNGVSQAAGATLSSALSHDRGLESFGKVAAQLEGQVDAAIAERFEDAKRARLAGKGLPQVACCKGCSACCHTMRVLASGLEIVRLTQHVQATRTEAEIDALINSLKAYDREARILADGAPASQRLACPFLDKDACSVYPARPIACRVFHSLDVSKCIERYHDPTKAEVPQLIDVHVAVAPISSGITQALAKNNLRESPLLLWKAMLIALEDPTACSRYLGGEDVFDPATSRAIEKAASNSRLIPI